MSITNNWSVWRSRWRSRIAIKRRVYKSNPIIQRRRTRIQNRFVQTVIPSPQQNNKWIVLLTTCVKTHPLNSTDDQEHRIDLYKTQIQKWLNNTNYDIVVVESSGCDSFSDLKCNTRLHVYTTIINADCSSQSEAKSMLYVIDQIKNEDFYLHCTHILKVTGRYYLQNIEHILQTYPKQNMNMYVQQHKNSSIRWQHTEYYGIKKGMLKDFLEPVSNTGYMEHRLYDFIDINRNVCILPQFSNNIARGGDGLIINPL